MDITRVSEPRYWAAEKALTSLRGRTLRCRVNFASNTQTHTTALGTQEELDIPWGYTNTNDLVPRQAQN